ncbi:MAG: hypothetical protein IJ200_08315 [Prevotella sp.]|nr:hypothetical protein [Prevotella sp.]
MKRLSITTAVMLAALGTQAQVSMGSYRYADETQVWRLTENAAALPLDLQVCDSTANRGIALFGMQHGEGDYHRVQEGGTNNHLSFFTERYQKIGRYLYGYGSFHFDMGRTKDRSWSDVVRSYNSNPFISGSSVPGKYDNQDFELRASLSTVQLGHFTYGASLLYQVGDLSRLRDPRSRINLAAYRLSPSATYTAGRHTIGLAAHYNRRKEKLTNLTTVQTDPNLAYYLMTGLENAEGTIGGYQGYMREYVNHEVGMELSYGIRGNGFRSVNALSLASGTEYVYGNYKYEPGKYKTAKYCLTSRNRMDAGSLLHAADLTIGYETGYADEYKEERITTKDAATGETSTTWQKLLEYKKRYQLKKLDLDLHYRLSFLAEEAVTGYVGGRYTLQSVSNKHVLHPSELKYSASWMQIEGGLSLKSRLWIEATAGYHASHQASLSLHDAATDYAREVLLPDMAYYEANYFKGGLQLTCQLPVTIKGYTANWFAKVYGTWLKTNNSIDGTTVGLSIGLHY